MQDRAAGRVYPQVNNIRMVSLNVAHAVARVAIESNLSRNMSKRDLGDLKKRISDKMYNPLYVPLVHQHRNPGD